MKTIENWTIIELSNFVLNGSIGNDNFYTDRLILLKDGYAITNKNIYKLGEPDKTWVKSESATKYINLFL